MGKKPRMRRRWFLRHWREYRKLSQEKLADQVGMTQGMISHLETGATEFTSRHLELLAGALGCKPADLLTRDPTDPDAPWLIWDDLSSDQKRQAMDILKIFHRNAGG